MGQEAEAEARRDAFAGFQVNDALLDAAGPDVVVMHCLPAHRGEEITSAVMDGPRSLIWEQSENRLHVQKALLVGLLDGLEARMSEELYERYKDALRRTSAVRGRLDVAEAAYHEAPGSRLPTSRQRARPSIDDRARRCRGTRSRSGGRGAMRGGVPAAASAADGCTLDRLADLERDGRWRMPRVARRASSSAVVCA